MSKIFIAVGALVALSTVGLVTLAGKDLRRDDQAVMARWSDLQAAHQAQFADVPAVLALADSQPTLDARLRAGARSHCGLLAQMEGDPTLVADAQRFDRYKQTRAECTGTLFRVLGQLRADPVLASNGHVQALGSALTQGQTRVDAARERYRQALTVYNQSVSQWPGHLAALVLGYQARPDFVRYANAQS